MWQARLPQRPTTLTSRTSRTSARLAMTNSTPPSHSLLRVQVSTVSASSNHTLTSHMKQDEQPQAVFAEHSLLPLAPPNRRWHQHRQRPFVLVLCRIKSSAMTEWIPGLPHPFQGQLFHHHHDDLFTDKIKDTSSPQVQPQISNAISRAFIRPPFATR